MTTSRDNAFCSQFNAFLSSSRMSQHWKSSLRQADIKDVLLDPQIENRLTVKRSFTRAVLHNKSLPKEKEDLMVVFMLSNIKEMFKVRKLRGTEEFTFLVVCVFTSTHQISESEDFVLHLHKVGSFTRSAWRTQGCVGNVSIVML